VFLGSFVISFLIFLKLLKNFGKSSTVTLSRALNDIDYSNFWKLVLWSYVFLHVFPLIYPEFRLQELLSPQSPDLKTALASRFSANGTSILEKITEYLRILLTPFFFLALYRLRERMTVVLSLFVLLIYLQFVDNLYIGRSYVFVMLSIFCISFWVWRPKLRLQLTLFIASALPMLLIVAHLYTIIRIGGEVSHISFYDSLSYIFENETNYPATVGVPLFNSGKYVDFSEYLKWIFTLPIPKILTGEIGGSRINYEISEIVLGVVRSDYRFYVVLPGLVSESVYIFGFYFFWLHAIFIGFISAVLVRLLEGTRNTLFLLAYIITLMFYVFNRGGVASVLPNLINGFLLFFIYIFATKYRVINNLTSK
jgi:hypothetical protein